MSMQALNWIKPKRVTVAQKCILWALADHANAAGECRLLLSTLSEETCLGRSALINGLKALARLGLIIKQPMQGRSTIYRLNLEAREPEQPLGDPESSRSPVHIVDPSPPAEVAPTRPHGGPPPSISWTPPVHMVDPEPSYESISKPEERGNARKAKPTRAVKTTIPPEFGISPAVQAWADRKGYTRLDEHLEAFTDKANANGYQYVDWDAALMNAIRNDWAKLRSPSYQPRLSAFERVQQSGRELLREHGEGNIIDIDNVVYPAQFQNAQGAPQGAENTHQPTTPGRQQIAARAPREAAPTVETYSPAWEPVYQKAVAQRAAEQERLERSVKAALPELERLDREARARQLARLGKMQAAEAMA